MIYNKGTVSFDQWIEKLKEAGITEGVGIAAFDINRLEKIYWSGADTDEALQELKND